MAQSQSNVTVLEQFSVAPPPGKVAGFSLPLTLLDLKWVHISPVQRLIFYEHPISKTHFVDAIIPHLKNSLSLSLQYYPPLAAKLTVPSDYSMIPEIRYVDGDNVPLVSAVSDQSDRFDYLTSNHARNCSEFHPLVPQLPPIRRASDDGSVQMAMLAVQVTLFPEAGICVGITNLHAVGDGRSIFGFMKAWTTLSILGQKSLSVSLAAEYQPVLDRGVVKDPKGLTTLMWNQIKHIKIEDTHGEPLPAVTDKVRARFIVTRNDIKKLKSHIISLRPELVQPSSFVVTCAYMWICLLKSQCVASRFNSDEDNDDTVLFGCPADCRTRMDPPVPANYFGNCLTPCLAFAKARQLVGEEGLVVAAEAIGEAIHRQLYGEEGVLRDAENWIPFFTTTKLERALTVAGSPRFDYYKMDFGWGNPKTIEFVSIDYTGAISLGCCRDSVGDLEVGVSVSMSKMHAFKTLFDEGLEAL